MKAVRAASPGVSVEEIHEPAGDGELIKVTAVSICASDLSYIKRGSVQVVGHEIAGVTADGTPVAVEGIFGCGSCAWCTAGRFNDGVSQLGRVTAMLAARPEIAATLITHRFEIGEAGRAFEVAARRANGTFRVAVHP